MVGIPLLYIQLQIEQDKCRDTNNPLIGIPIGHPLYNLIHWLNLVVDTNDKTRQYDAAFVMLQPFFKLADQSLCFTGTHDFALITDKAWANYLFQEGYFTAYFPKMKNINNLLSYLGSDYVEKFLMAKIFSSLHRTGMRVVFSDDQKTPNFTLVINETDVFMIEVKSVSLHFNVWQDQNLVKFKEHLNEQHLSEKKGVIQLHKSMQHLANDPQGLFQLKTPLRKVKVYPVIIYTEPHLSTVGINDYVIQESPKLDPALSQRFNSVAPVTLIDYDFFLENLKVIRGNKFILKEAINRYHSGTKQCKLQWKKVNTTMNFSKAMETFDNFSAGYSGLYLENQNAISAEIKKVFNPPADK